MKDPDSQTLAEVNVGKEKGYETETQFTSETNTERRGDVQAQTRRERDGLIWTQYVLLTLLQNAIGVDWKW